MGAWNSVCSGLQTEPMRWRPQLSGVLSAEGLLCIMAPYAAGADRENVLPCLYAQRQNPSLQQARVLPAPLTLECAFHHSTAVPRAWLSSVCVCVRVCVCMCVCECAQNWRAL